MREHNKPKRPGKPASIDGFVSDGRQLGMPTHRAYKPMNEKPTPTLDTFVRRPDGFHSLRQSPHSLGQSPEASEVEALLNEPIVLDEQITSKKKGKRYGKPSRVRKFIKRASLSLGVLVLVVGAYFAFKIYVTQKHLLRGGGKAPALAEKIDINKLKGEGDGRVNVLLLGIGGPGHEGGDLTDTIMLMSIDPVNHKTSLLSIPRDLWVKIPGDGYQKINAAYVYGKQAVKSKDNNAKVRGGLDLLDNTISPIIGVPIHYHAVINFQAFKQGVDAVGGVTFNVPETLYDPTIAWENHGNSYIAKQGIQSFDGAKALLYARSRETSSDFARGQRQRQVMVALKDKIFSAGTFSNPVKISSLLSSFGNNIYTDFSLNDIKRIYQIMGQTPSSDIVSLDLVSPPHNLLTTGNMNGLSIVEPRAGLFEYADIQNYVRTALRDGFLEKENAKVAVYNATDIVGLATKKANELKSFGYYVTEVANAPTTTNPATTTVVDLTKNTSRFTRHYLENRFKTSARSNLPPGTNINPPEGTTFVIILGKDAANTQ